MSHFYGWLTGRGKSKTSTGHSSIGCRIGTYSGCIDVSCWRKADGTDIFKVYLSPHPSGKRGHTQLIASGVLDIEAELQLKIIEE